MVRLAGFEPATYGLGNPYTALPFSGKSYQNLPFKKNSRRRKLAKATISFTPERDKSGTREIGAIGFCEYCKLPIYDSAIINHCLFRCEKYNQGDSCGIIPRRPLRSGPGTLGEK
jgi:hypothetical protein